MTDGEQLAVFQLSLPGSGASRPSGRVLFVHGEPESGVRDLLPRAAPAVLAGFEVYIAEPRGIGLDGERLRARSETESSLERRVADQQTVIDFALGTDTGGGSRPLFLIGSGPGAAVTAEIGRTDPRVSLVVLVSPPGDAVSDGRAARCDDTLLVPCLMIVPGGTTRAEVAPQQARLLPDGARIVVWDGLDADLLEIGGERDGFPLVELDVLDFLLEHGVLDRATHARLTKRARTSHPEWFGDDEWQVRRRVYGPESPSS